jgi:mannose-6-phosphate isomerase-like protein (cupin superfamily)
MSALADIQQEAAASWFADQAGAAARDWMSEGGQVAMIERSARSGQMPPLLRRDEDETYRVAAGRVTFFVGAETIAAGPGDVVVAPAGVPRTFRAEAEGSRWLVLTRVRSLARFLDFGRAVSAPLADPAGGWPSAEEMAAVAGIAAANGIELLGPPGALTA